MIGGYSELTEDKRRRSRQSKNSQGRKKINKTK